ncbi:putative transposase [Shigella boydii 5216-82]|nr:putative transposase [Shigella boydii 5216-82]
MFTFYKPFFVSIEIVCQTLALCSVQISQQLCLKWHTEFGHLNRGDMLTSEQHRCSNEKKKF